MAFLNIDPTTLNDEELEALGTEARGLWMAVVAEQGSRKEVEDDAIKHMRATPGVDYAGAMAVVTDKRKRDKEAREEAIKAIEEHRKFQQEAAEKARAQAQAGGDAVVDAVLRPGRQGAPEPTPEVIEEAPKDPNIALPPVPKE